MTTHAFGEHRCSRPQPISELTAYFLSTALLAGTLLLGLAATASGQADPFADLKGATGSTVQYRNAELVRNGDFNLNKSAWAVVGSFTMASTEAARDQGGVGISLWTGAQGEHLAYMIQEVYPPVLSTRATISLDYRLAGRQNMQGAYLQGFQVMLATTEGGQFRPVHTLLEITSNNYPGPSWQRMSFSFDNALLLKMNTLRSQGKPIYIWINLGGTWLDLAVDNVSFRIDGSTAFPAIPGVIAYSASRLNKPSGYEIRGVAPDGSHDALILASDIGDCSGLAWRPDGLAVAIASSHESAHSRWTADLYELSRKGFRRITNPPSQAEIQSGGYATGTVTGKVRNISDEQRIVAVYIEGAREAVFVTLQPYNHIGDTADFVVPNVADLGNTGQYVVAREGYYTWLAANFVDVRAGGTVELVGDLQVDAEGFSYVASSPTWCRDGSGLLLVAGKFLYVPASGGYGSIPFGWRDSPICMEVAWSPVDDRILYIGYPGTDIWLTRALENAETTSLAEFHGASLPQDPAWLPDGSGFVFTMGITEYSGYYTSRDIMIYRFSNGSTLPLTQLYNENIRNIAVSPDGRFAAFERIMMNSASGNDFRSVQQLWVMQLNNPALMWPIVVKGNPGQPTWSSRIP